MSRKDHQVSTTVSLEADTVGVGVRSGIMDLIMPPATLPTPHLVQDEASYRALVKTLRKQPFVAVDTESNSLYAYREKVCLIQFSVPEADYLLDPLALPDLQALGSIFSDPRIEKIFHGAEYDVKTLKRDFNYRFANLFDTHVASRTLGMKQTGLRDLLLGEFEVQLDKRLQRANWGKRPLTAELMAYARLDTHYLLPLRDRLVERLEAGNHLDEVLEACALITLAEAHDNGFDPEGYWGMRNTRKLTRQQMAILRELYLLRDAYAQKLDRPPFKVMGDQTLIAIAKESPRDHDQLKAIPGISAGQMRRYGKELLESVLRGLKAPKPKPPSSPAFDEAVHQRYEALRTWRKNIARARQVESDIILPRETLWDIARLAPRDRKTLRRIMAPLETRYQRYGGDILHLLHP